MKKLFLLGLLTMLSIFNARAIQFAAGGVCYRSIHSDTDASHVEVMSAWPKYIGEVNIPATVEYNGTTYSVIAIGEEAFLDCIELTSVTIGEGVTSIKDRAFYNCPGLTSVTIPNSVTAIGENAFSYCSGLTSVVIGEGVTTIAGYAFSYCSRLTSVEWNARHCMGFASVSFTPSTLTSITFGDQVAYIPAYLCNLQTLLTSVTIPNSVTAIGEQAFRECWGLTSVTIPNSVTAIGEEAFFACSGLTSVTIGEGVTTISSSAFSDCYKLTSLTIPNSVTTIGSSAFANCHDLESVTIGEGVTTIGESAFKGCTVLPSVTIPNSVISIGNKAFAGCDVLMSVTIPNSVTAIGEEAFASCALKSVTIPESVTSIGDKAFKDCTKLTSVEWNARNGQDITHSPFPDNLTSITFGNKVAHIPAHLCFNTSGLTSVTIGEGVTTIGEYAFDGCTGLTSVEWNAKNCQDYQDFTNDLFSKKNLTSITFGDKVERIPAYLCYDQGGLTSVTIPNSVTAIGSYAFAYTGLTSVTIGEGVTTISSYAFANTRLTSVTIPNSVDTIGFSAFDECSHLTSVTIGKGVTTIGNKAFKSCRDLTSVTIPNSVTSIGEAAFANCDDLTSVTIPNSVTSIGDKAFANCYKLTSVFSLAKTPPTCGSSAFAGIDTLYVRCGCKADYETAVEWSSFSEIIEWCVYTVTLQVNDETMGSVTGDKEYAYDGTQATLTAIPNAGYHFVKWDDGNTDNPHTLTVTKDTTLTAEFAINIYTVTVNVNDATRGTVSGGDTYAFGSSATLEAVPNEGYHFVKWNDGNTDNPRTLTVTKDTTLTAVFAINTFTLNVSANKPEWGSVSQSGNGTYDSASPVTITAMPNEGYRFVNWTKGNAVFSTQADTTFTIKENLALVANFEKLPTDPTANEASLAAAPFAYVQGRTVYLSDGLGEVEAFTFTGQRVYRGFDRTFALPRPGVYILHVVADGRRCKVVVK